MNDYDKIKQRMIVRQSSIKAAIDYFGHRNEKVSFENLLKTSEVIRGWVEVGLSENVIKNAKQIDNIYPVEKELTDDQKHHYYSQKNDEDDKWW